MIHAIKHYEVSQLEQQDPEFIAFMKESYAKRGWSMPTHIHIDLGEMTKKMNKRADALKSENDYFWKNGVFPEKPKQVKL